MFWFWLMMVLLITSIALLPVWPYGRARRRGYRPTVLVFMLLMALLVFWWLGLIIVELPWQAYVP